MKTKLFVGAVAVALLALCPSARAEEKPIDSIIRGLHERGLVSDADYQTYQDQKNQEAVEARAQRRRDAQKAAEAANREEQSQSSLVGRFNDGFVFETKDKTSALNLNGRLHADYRQFSNQDLVADTFDIRRAYLTLGGRINHYVTFDLTADVATAGGTASSSIDVAWVNYSSTPGLQFRAGQFKMPMSLEEQTSSRFLDFQERSFVNQLTPGKERGFMVHGSPTPSVVYAVAVSNGQGKNNNDVIAPADGKDLIARLVYNAAEDFGWKSSVAHFGVAYSAGSQPTGSGFSLRTEPRGMTWFNAASFTGSDYDRKRGAVEFALAHHSFKLQGEQVQVDYAQSGKADRDITARYVEALWMITGESYADTYRAGAFGRMRPRSNFGFGSDGWGAWEIGLRFSDINADSFRGATAGQSSGTPQLITAATGARAITLGLKWIINPNTRVLLNYIDTRFDTPVAVKLNYNGLADQRVDSERAITVRFSVDF